MANIVTAPPTHLSLPTFLVADQVKISLNPKTYTLSHEAETLNIILWDAKMLGPIPFLSPIIPCQLASTHLILAPTVYPIVSFY